VNETRQRPATDFVRSASGNTGLRRIASVVAVVFGLATIVAGSRVLAGADPGYVVFRPLLIYNTVMGGAYLAAGLGMWRSLRWGRHAAAIIFVLNLLVFSAIVLFYITGSAVAIDSVWAMALRTAVWLALFLGLVWTGRR